MAMMSTRLANAAVTDHPSRRSQRRRGLSGPAGASGTGSLSAVGVSVMRPMLSHRARHNDPVSLPQESVDDLTQPAVTSSVVDGVRWIVFNRPAKLNALTVADIGEITRLVTDPGPGTRALAFTGAGARSFCAGVHTTTFVDLDPDGARAFITGLRDCLAAVRTSPRPAVAMINGYCLGAGFELALACDLRMSTPDSQFGLPEVKVGVPSVIDAALLPGYVGLALAKEIILTGDLYPAAELQRLGLLNRMVPAEQLRAETDELLGRVTRHTPVVLASQKRLFESWLNRPLTDAIAESVEEFAGVFAAPETHEQIRRYRQGG
jgi:enoyl-CoA hydratase/carnithine racemase